MRKVGIRREDKDAWEARVPLVPDDVKGLVARRRATICVQPSAQRVFADDAYAAAGAAITEDLDDCDVVLAVKEIPHDVVPAGQDVRLLLAHHQGAAVQHGHAAPHDGARLPAAGLRAHRRRAQRAADLVLPLRRASPASSTRSGLWAAGSSGKVSRPTRSPVSGRPTRTATSARRCALWPSAGSASRPKASPRRSAARDRRDRLRPGLARRAGGDRRPRPGHGPPDDLRRWSPTRRAGTP